MAQHGSGTGSQATVPPIPPVTTTEEALTCTAVSLTRYAARIGYRECAFFGVMHPDNPHHSCSEIWSKAQRDMIAWALAEAQAELEQEIHYPLCPQWFTDERVPYASRIFAHWCKVIEPGVMLDTMLSDSAPVNHAADPATIGPVVLAGCDADNARLFFHGTNDEIEPLTVTEVAGSVTFTVPWCRLVDPAYQDNPDTGLDYNDSATWIAHTVDVRCISNDPSTQATLIWRYNPLTCAPGCEDTRLAACMYVRNPELGIVDVRQATYAAGSWAVSTACSYGTPDWVLLNYYAGVQTLTRQQEDAIIRLAHSKMAEEPCGCDVTQRLWRRDRTVPEVLTRERVNCPFGTSDGAWWAYRQAQTMRIVRGGVL